MIDFIFAVSEPVQWHALNLRQNGHHYATLPRILGSNFISHLQQGYGGKVWFNVECEVNGRVRL
jgi:translocator assembly and maintenance protein 41